MEFTIFYSWQSDSPLGLNKNFIEDALRQTVAAIINEKSLPDIPIVDMGMERVPGSPEVATIMFRKIGRSAVILSDVTLVGEIKGTTAKKTANPNVMLELGYAAAYLGWERVICVMNEFFGTAEEQPIDVRNRRFPIDYKLGPKTESPDKVKDKLVGKLKGAIEGVWSYDLECANDALSSLDINCMNVYGAFGKGDCFSAPDPRQTDIGGPLDTAKFNAAILRLLDLKLIRSEVNAGAGLYAYHWTFLGKKVAEKLGSRPQQTR